MSQIDLKIIKREVKYPEEIIRTLSNMTVTLEACRRIYLGTTMQGKNQMMPILLMEIIEENPEQDINTSEFIMSHVFEDEDFVIKPLPVGPWWNTIAELAQKVRDLHS